MQWAKFATWGKTAAIESIETTIRNGWQGLFQPKGERTITERRPTLSLHALQEREKRLVIEKEEIAYRGRTHPYSEKEQADLKELNEELKRVRERIKEATK
jgi:hypothetical protein